MAARSDVLHKLVQVRDEITAVVESAPESHWSASVSENDWTAHDLLAHIASTSGVAGYVLMMATVGAQSGGGEAFDQDQFNGQQVELRAERSAEDLLNEARSNIQRDIQAIEAAPDDLLSKHFVAQWGAEGSVAEVIIASLEGHLGEHITDLRAGLA